MASGGLKVGVLALQGGFAEHISHLKQAITSTLDSKKNSNFEVVEVRVSSQLADLDGLVIPGGESGTLSVLLQSDPEMLDALRYFTRTKPVFGTCAGLILLANEVEGQKLEGQLTIGGLPIKVRRNHYGRQAQSFEVPLCVEAEDFPETNLNTPMLFIRAPGIVSILSEEVQILAKYKDSIVAVRQNHVLATSFHPELTDDLSWHIYFVRIILYHKQNYKFNVSKPTNRTLSDLISG